MINKKIAEPEPDPEPEPEPEPEPIRPNFLLCNLV